MLKAVHSRLAQGANLISYGEVRFDRGLCGLIVPGTRERDVLSVIMRSDGMTSEIYVASITECKKEEDCRGLCGRGCGASRVMVAVGVGSKDNVFYGSLLQV